MSYYPDDMYSNTRAYNVTILAEDGNGNEVRFTEVASYVGQSLPPIAEAVRQAKAIEQVKRRMPHLINVRADGSIHV